MTLVKWHYFSVNIWSLAFTELTKYMVPRITVFIRLEVLQFDAWYSWRRFCSEECRIRNECDWFSYTVMETLNEKKLPGKNPHDSTKCKRPTSQCHNFSYLKLQLSRPNFMCTSVVWGTKNCTIFVDDRIVWSLISLVFSIVLNECYLVNT